MAWWILIGIVLFIIVLLIILKIVNKKDYKVVRMGGLGEKNSAFKKFLDACCLHRS